MPEPMELLAAFAGDTLRQTGLPGLSVAVTGRTDLLDAAAFGLADVARGEPVTTRTRFEIGSIGKSFTAVALLQLVEEGRVDLSAPVERYLPWFDAGPGAPITVHHLLTHTGGLIEGADLSSDSRYDVWALRHEPRAEPGLHYHYSNVGFRALGYVLEQLEGEPYPAIVHRRILGPLALDGVDAAITHETRRDLAVGHERLYDDRPAQPDEPLVPAPWIETGTGDGSIAAGAAQLAAFLRALLRHGEPLLTRPSFDLLLRHAVAAGKDEWYGYGIGTKLVEGRERLGHGGSMPGFGSAMLGDLEAGVGVVVLTNGPDEGDLTKQVATYALALWRAAAGGLDLPERPVYRPREIVPGEDVDAPEWVAYTGRFRSHNPWLSNFAVAARADGLRLVFPWGSEEPLAPLEDGVFRVGEEDWSPERLRFDALVDGRALRANLSGCDYYRVPIR